VSTTSVDLPEPETPVTQMNRPSGSRHVTSFRLLPRAPVTTSSRVASARRRVGPHVSGAALAWLEARTQPIARR
jgi:hypothetical protein